MKDGVLSLSLGLILGLLVGYFIWGIGFTGTGSTISTQPICKTSTGPATYEVIGSKECIREKGLFGGINKECSVQIKNTASQPADFKITFECFTVKSSSNPDRIESTTKPLSSNQIGTFTISYDSKGNDFKCNLIDVKSSEVLGCSLSYE